jgi:hypothetical protein
VIFYLLLKLEGYKVKTEISIAKNGQEALDFLFKRGFMNKKHLI